MKAIDIMRCSISMEATAKQCQLCERQFPTSCSTFVKSMQIGQDFNLFVLSVDARRSFRVFGV